jgi:hypothetical protein
LHHDLVPRGELKMSTNDSFPKTGIIVTGDEENLDNMSEMVNSTLFRRVS